MSAAGSRVELYSAIRRDARAGLSNRALQRRHRVGYRTVAAALASAWPKARKPPPKRGSRLDPYVEVIDDWLRDDLDAPRKQRSEPRAEPTEPPGRQAVRSLTERRLRAQLPADDRPLPTMDKYDQLLTSHRENPNQGAAP